VKDDPKNGLPAGWTEARLADTAQVRLGRQRSPAQASGPHMKPYIRAGNITWGGLDLSNVKEMNFSPKEQEVYRLRAGDILLSEASGSPGEVGKPAIWNEALPECYFQNTVIRVRPPPGLTKFLFFQLLRDVLAGRFIDHSKGVGINHLGSERLSELTIRIAPEPQRTQIVEHVETQLSRIEAGVQVLRSAAARLAAYRAAVLKAACHGRLVPTEATLARREGRDYEPADRLLDHLFNERQALWEVDQLARRKGSPAEDERWKAKYERPKEPETCALAELPQGWCWTTVGSLISKIDAGASFKCDERPPMLGEVGVVKVSAVTWGHYQELESKTCTDPARIAPALYVEEGNFLFSRANTIDLVGACVIATSVTRKIMLSDKILRLRLLSIEPRWLLTALRSRFGRDEIERLATGNQESMRNIGQDRLRQVRVPLPPTAEQARIVSEVDRMMSLADDVERTIRAQLARAKQLRRAVLRDAFEGRPVAEQQPASSSRRPPHRSAQPGIDLPKLEGTP
jgi:type I restriction enzyme S subunit